MVEARSQLFSRPLEQTLPTPTPAPQHRQTTHHQPKPLQPTSQLQAKKPGVLPKFEQIGKVYVAGISSGGYMAGQLHVAYSNQISGAAIFAGGPYGCASGSLEKALAACTDDSSDLDLGEILSLTTDASALGSIDPISNLAGAPVWLFHGQSDATLKAPIADANAAFYASFGADLIYNNATNANHAWVSPLGFNPCTVSAAPYTSNCPGMDPQYDLLSHLLRRPISAAAASASGVLTAYSQDSYTIDRWGLDASMLSMDTTGYIYVPQNCNSTSGNTCDVIMVLHGCEQSVSIVGQALIQQAHMNEYADTNNIILLYPQTIAMEEGVVLNPKACWDWWGFLGDDDLYAVHGSYQMEVLMNMINSLKLKK